jgi:hypothetical protein
MINATMLAKTFFGRSIAHLSMSLLKIEKPTTIALPQKDWRRQPTAKR